MNNKIFILGYPFGDYVECYPGIITSISDNDFEHNCNTDEGSSAYYFNIKFNCYRYS